MNRWPTAPMSNGSGCWPVRPQRRRPTGCGRCEAWQPAPQTRGGSRRPWSRPLPTAPDLLLSHATECQPARSAAAMPLPLLRPRRSCGLDEPDELEAALAKRDYGNWLHAGAAPVPRRRRDAGWPPMPLPQPARRRRHRHARPRPRPRRTAALPPPASSTSCPRTWPGWHGSAKGEGWHWSRRRKRPSAWRIRCTARRLRLRGRIDRLDHGPDGSQSQLIDYKTGSRPRRSSARSPTPLEDTQLAFYAALLGCPDGDPALPRLLPGAGRRAQAPLEIEHIGGAPTAQPPLIAGTPGGRMATPARRAQPHAGPGREATVCDTCEARGLCRRDHWAAA